MSRFEKKLCVLAIVFVVIYLGAIGITIQTRISSKENITRLESARPGPGEGQLMLAELFLPMMILLTIRGETTAAVATLARSGLFEVVVLDLAGVSDRERRRLPATTWIRLQRTVEDTETALLLVADGHVAVGPGGAALALASRGPEWSTPPGPGRLLAGLGAQVSAGRHMLRSAEIALAAFA